MKITVLGSGTSHGVPVVGCGCAVCTSDDERDKRTRASVYIEGGGGERALIDAGPEFRLQAVRAGITRLDAIFLTHSHADHLHGLDDVRPLCREKSIPVYGNKPAIEEMEERFSYVWRETQRGGGKPKLSPVIAGEPVCVGGLTFTPLPVRHGVLDILGWEVRGGTGRNFLYLTDTNEIPPATFDYLAGDESRHSRVIIIGGLRIRPHATHFSFEEALNTGLGLGASELYLTHLCHDHSHREIEEFCRAFGESRGVKGMEIHPARDGLELTL